MPNCIVCGNPSCKHESVGSVAGATRYDCPRCGSFVLSGTAESVLPGELARDHLVRASLMSHVLRRMQRPDKSHLRVIVSDELPSFWRGRLPSPLEQADALIVWVGDHQIIPFDWVETTAEVIAATVGLPVFKSGDGPGLGWLLSEVTPNGLFKNMDRSGGKIGFQLTMSGWGRYGELKKTSRQSRTAFMAMKFGDQLLDRVVADCFRPAVARAGFKLRLLTDEQPAGLIDDQLRSAILSARLLIADLTHGNAGAYWEAGFAEGLGLPVIYTCESTAWARSKTHFDTNHMKTIIWEEANLEKAGKELTATTRVTLRGEAKQSDDG